MGEGRVPIFCTQGDEGVSHVIVSLFLQSCWFEQSCYEMVERQSTCYTSFIFMLSNERYCENFSLSNSS